jgi:hypothetical protein
MASGMAPPPFHLRAPTSRLFVFTKFYVDVPCAVVVLSSGSRGGIVSPIMLQSSARPRRKSGMRFVMLLVLCR